MIFNNLLAEEMLEEARLILDIGTAIPVNTPSLVILGGQPGSGKSSAIEIIEARFESNIFALNGDDFKELYPNYAELVKADKEQASHEVQEYSNYVVNNLKREYSDSKYNIIIEGTMRTIDAPLSTLNEFKPKGYQAEAYVVSSNYYASRTGCLLRMEMDTIENGYGRAVPVESHDQAYNNIPTTMQELIESGKLDNLIVMSRSGKVLGSLSAGDDVVNIYMEHRKQLSFNEYKQINTNLNEIKVMMQNRNASKHEIATVQDLQSNLLKSYAHSGKFILTNFQTEVNGLPEQLPINTNSDVIQYFRQYDKDNKIPTWIEQGKIKTDNDFHYLENENPERVASVLNYEFKTDIKVIEVEAVINKMEKSIIEIE
jgi:broad-specificity NMP kinase